MHLCTCCSFPIVATVAPCNCRSRWLPQGRCMVYGICHTTSRTLHVVCHVPYPTLNTLQYDSLSLARYDLNRTFSQEGNMKECENLPLHDVMEPQWSWIAKVRLPATLDLFFQGGGRWGSSAISSTHAHMQPGSSASLRTTTVLHCHTAPSHSPVDICLCIVNRCTRPCSHPATFAAARVW